MLLELSWGTIGEDDDMVEFSDVIVKMFSNDRNKEVYSIFIMLKTIRCDPKRKCILLDKILANSPGVDSFILRQIKILSMIISQDKDNQNNFNLDL